MPRRAPVCGCWSAPVSRVEVRLSSRSCRCRLERFFGDVAAQDVGSGAAAVVVGGTGPAAVRQRRELQRTSILWWAWSRNPGDVDGLRELHEVLGEGQGL